MKIAIVPKTMAKFLCSVKEGLMASGRNSPKLIHAITANPETTAATAGKLVLVFPKSAKKNKPKMPPLKIEAKAHQASKALSTPLKANPTNSPAIPIPKEAAYKTLIWVFQIIISR